ncbi:hypothetical protein ACTJJ4_08970 [Microbacterium sp. 22195]|uniref:hypothetical protein n=1 Tax=Microbacterium sp. 22195 TaxID=3453891 RepID=UPI003F846D5F
MSGIDQGMMPEHVQPQHAEDDSEHEEGAGAPEEDETRVDTGAEDEAEPNREHRAEEPKPIGEDAHPEGGLPHRSQRKP